MMSFLLSLFGVATLKLLLQKLIPFAVVAIVVSLVTAGGCNRTNSIKHNWQMRKAVNKATRDTEARIRAECDCKGKKWWQLRAEPIPTGWETIFFPCVDDLDEIEYEELQSIIVDFPEDTATLEPIPERSMAENIEIIRAHRRANEEPTLAEPKLIEPPELVEPPEPKLIEPPDRQAIGGVKLVPDVWTVTMYDMPGCIWCKKWSAEVAPVLKARGIAVDVRRLRPIAGNVYPYYILKKTGARLESMVS